VRVVLTASAVADLQEIGDWVATDNPAAAFELIEAIRERCLQLGEHPKAFPLVPRYESLDVRRRPYRN
jgi:toxin ParE1/3/4